MKQTELTRSFLTRVTVLGVLGVRVAVLCLCLSITVTALTLGVMALRALFLSIQISFF